VNRARASVLLLLALAAASCTSVPAAPYSVLQPGVEPLRTAFNRDAGHVRVVVLVAPTCGTCLFGVSEIQNKVLEKESSQALKVHLVWVPMFRGMERDVPRATRQMPDPRVLHYWDGENQLGKRYRKTLGISEDAWDVFLVYGPDAKWLGDEAPAPAYWMHQLGTARRPRVNGPYLDAVTVLGKVRELLP
jgi:hypothetical protein